MRILLIEDDALVAMAAEFSLRAAGHEIIGPFYRADAALDAAHLERPDVATVDIDLAGHNEGLGIVRDLFDLYGVRSIFATGQATLARDHRASVMGVLHKPYSANDLIDAFPVLQSIMGGATPLPPAIPSGLELFA